MTFEAYAREWLERQNFIKSTRKWTRQAIVSDDIVEQRSKVLEKWGL